jgi:hypothetical protein
MTLPTRDEINVYGSLDEVSACEHFLGLTLVMAEQLFRENGLFYQEDLMWMGPRAFAFYLPAALSYLRSEAARGDDDFLSCLHRVIEFRSAEEAFALARDTVRSLVDYVIANYAKFEVDAIHGDLLAKYHGLRKY